MSFFESEAGTGRVRERMYRNVHEGAGRSGRIGLAAGVAAIGIFVLVAAYSAYQVTTPSRTSVILERGVASVTDIDAFLAEELPGIREQANDGEASRIELTGFPLPITLAAEDVQAQDDVGIRDIMLERSASLVQEEGLGAFAQADDQSLGLLSMEGAISNLVGLLDSSTHSRAGIVAVGAAFMTALACAIIAASDLRPGVIKTIGGALLGGSFAGLLISAALVFIFSRTGGDPFSAEISRIAADIFEVPRRNFFVVMVFSALLYVAGIGLNFIERRAAEELYTQDLAYQQGDALAADGFRSTYDEEEPWPPEYEEPDATRRR